MEANLEASLVGELLFDPVFEAQESAKPVHGKETETESKGDEDAETIPQDSYITEIRKKIDTISSGSELSLSLTSI